MFDFFACAFEGEFDAAVVEFFADLIDDAHVVVVDPCLGASDSGIEVESRERVFGGFEGDITFDIEFDVGTVGGEGVDGELVFFDFEVCVDISEDGEWEFDKRETLDVEFESFWACDGVEGVEGEGELGE